jgi:hypothetical protein
MRVRSPRFLFAVAVALAVGTAGQAQAGEVPPDAGALLFEAPQLDNTRPGDVLTYAYSRRTADDAVLGPSFSDRVRLSIAPGSRAETRTVAVELFTGEHRRAAGPFQDMTGNPMVSLFLENHIGVLSTQLHVNPRYLKNAIRGSLRDKATIEAGPVEAGGRSLPGWHVRITPFKDDPNKDRMLGLDTMTYDFVVTNEIPGEVVEIHVAADNGQGASLLDEKIVYDAKAD